MQLELAGALAVADGRYLAREDGGQRVLVVETLGAPPPPPRRKRRAPAAAQPGALPSPLPLTRVTVVRASEPFDSTAEAARWLEEAVAAEETVDALVGEAVALLNRALHAHAATAADPYPRELAAESATTVRIGYGNGEEVAAGRFAVGREVDVRAPQASRRHRREAELRPQERVAAVLGGREQVDACETLLLRARADLDAGRAREAALQLEMGLEALLVELAGALTHPGHEGDMLTLGARRGEAREAARTALRGELGPESERQVRELTEICERVLRRRRLLRG